jgi:hypothetical protein
LGTTDNSLTSANNAPFVALFTMLGQFSDNTLYTQTIPFPAGVITQANAYTSPVYGVTNTAVTVGCTQYSGTCSFQPSVNAFVGWIDSTGKMTVLTTFTTTSSGNIPSNVQFQVPNAAQGYYTIMVSDYINTVFMTFQHT